METERTDLGLRVRLARLNKGWSKEQAAREARISAITWKRIEDGLSVQDAKRFAALRALGITEDAEADEIAADVRTRHPGITAQDLEPLVALIRAANLDEETRRRLLDTLREAQ